MFRQFLMGLAVVAASPVSADLLVAFNEGAPKDRVTLTNAGACPLGASVIVLDLTGSLGGLIFDVTGSGAGVSVYQPLEIVAGAERLVAQPEVSDGDREMTLTLNGLPAGDSVSFTIDVDDTAGKSETTVSGSEITGATVRVTAAGQENTGVFDASATARVMLSNCLS